MYGSFWDPWARPGRGSLATRNNRFALRMARRNGDLLAFALPSALLWLESGYVPIDEDENEPEVEQPIVDFWP
jgi:hypothetical protein